MIMHMMIQVGKLKLKIFVVINSPGRNRRWWLCW